MEKIKLDIVGISYSQTQSGAYALVLGESEGKRRLPIIIGNYEAQAIAIGMEKMKPNRPLTHDAFKAFADAFSVDLLEVIIYNLVEGIFYAKLICQSNDRNVEIDARTSDAIALAVRFKCPVYTYEFILSTAGILLEEDSESAISPYDDQLSEDSDFEESANDFKTLPIEELKIQLDEAIENEDYELASRIRDEINKRS